LIATGNNVLVKSNEIIETERLGVGRVINLNEKSLKLFKEILSSRKELGIAMLMTDISNPIVKRRGQSPPTCSARSTAGAL
jgi:hypothetical protein